MILSPAWGEEGLKVRLAPRLATTFTVWVEVVLTPSASVAVTETRKEPEVM